jgi:3-hydroxyisobutyrate dehydrogenase-like beta-hydroxyacid dehydrogenase/ketosteroid isomerase-like protein
MDVGFAGLGRMGRPMARHLAEAGYRVVAYDPAVRADAVPADLAAAGVRVTDEVSRLAEAEVSVSMLPDAAATERLLVGEEGLLGRCGSSHVHVVMGTVGPAAVRALAGKAQDAGVALVDAPVSGSVSLAEAGTITTMVGADPEVYAAVRPVLAAMTRAQFHTGPVGSGSAAKLAVNLALASLNQAIAEGLAVAAADGLDPGVFYDVLEASAVAAPYVSYKRATFVSPETADVAFPVSLLQKDVGLGLELAAEHGLDLPVATTVGRVLERAREAGLADHDMAEVLRLLQDHRNPGGDMAPDTLSRAQLDDLEDRRYAAMVDADLDALGELLSDDVLYAHSNASVDSKESYLKLIRTGALVYHELQHTTDDVITRPGLAILSGTMSGSIHMNGAAKTLNSRVAAVWVDEGGTWRLAAFQPTPIPG